VLDEEQITKFQTIYKNRFGTELNREDAYTQGIQLLQLAKLIYKPMTVDEFKSIQVRCREKDPICDHLKKDSMSSAIGTH